MLEIFENVLELPVQGAQRPGAVPAVVVELGAPRVLHVIRHAGASQHLGGCEGCFGISNKRCSKQALLSFRP